MLRYLLSFCFLTGVLSIQLNIIEVIIGQNVIYGHPASAPAFDVAFESLEHIYPTVLQNHTRKRIYKPGIYNCPDSAAIMIILAAEIERYLRTLNGFNILISSGCSLEIAVLGDFAREWNVPLFSSIAGDPSLANKVRFPTTLAYGPVDHGNMVLATKAFVDQFSWKNILLLCDSLSTSPALSTFYVLECSNIKNVLSRIPGEYNVMTSYIDSGSIADFGSTLEQIRPRARVVIIFTSPYILRKIMVTAFKKGMTSGDYVYLAPETTAVPTFGNLTWKYNDDDDDAAFDAFKSLIVFNNPNPKWDQIKDVSELRRNKTVHVYNYTFTDDTLYNDLAVSAYEMITTIIQVLNESDHREMTATDFCQLFMNRTFHLPSRTFYISPFGLRFSDVEFYRVDQTSGKLEEVWHYYSRSNRIERTSILGLNWTGGGGPPLDVPLCGFQGERCLPVSNFATVLGIAIGGALGALVLLIILTLFIRRKIGDVDVSWWDLNANTEYEADGFIDDVHHTRNPGDSKTRRQYKSHPVCFEIFNLGTTRKDLLSSAKAAKLLIILKNVHHLNISSFYGIFLADKTTELIYELPERGSLHAILENSNVHFDRFLQRSITWELLDGVHYIHQSRLGWHGHLSPFCVFLDKRFTVKIGGYVYTHLSRILHKSEPPADTAEIPFRAPEILSPLHDTVSRRAADVFSLSKMCELVIIRVSADEAVDEMSRQLRNLFASGQSQSPSERPSVHLMMTTLQKLSPRINMVDSMMRRLEKYSADLEGLVSERTQDLMHEREKSDELLRTMIPPKFINLLRNKQVIPAENFDCVTVMFSDLPFFAALCSTSSPLEVTLLLNTIYAALDTVISGFDAYKVETINDSYVVASGLPERNKDRHVVQIALLALEFMNTFASPQLASRIDSSLKLRIGFHSGPCAAGVVGLRMPRYCLFGDTINTASRMESHGEECRIHLSNDAQVLLSHVGGFRMEHRGQINIKGKGLRDTYWLITKDASVAGIDS